MHNNIFFDFDGTLIDSSRRQYNLFAELTSVNKFTYEDYWSIKKNKISQKYLLKKYFFYSDEKIECFKKSWMEKIEEPYRILTDTPFNGVTNLLQGLSPIKNLYLVTARQDPDLVYKQLDIYGWLGLFKEVFVTQQKESKSQLVLKSIKVDRDDIFVGDTGEDVLSGKEMGVKTIAVSSGVLNQEALSFYKPDLLVENVCLVPWSEV